MAVAGLRGLELAQTLVAHTEVEVGVGVVGPQSDRLLIAGDRRWQVSLLAQQISPGIVNFGKLGSQGDRRLVSRDRLGGPALLAEGNAEAMQGLWIVGLEGDRLLVGRNGGGQLVEMLQR